MTRDCHAGICGSRGLKCPRPPDLVLARLVDHRAGRSGKAEAARLR